MQETAERQTVADFVKAHGVKLTCEAWHENPHMDDSAGMHHWRCRLHCGESSMSLYYSMGWALAGKRPELADVLDCLASDAATIENAPTFEQWAEELGYDMDSRKEERTFITCRDQAGLLRVVLGDGAYEDLLYNTERE